MNLSFNTELADKYNSKTQRIRVLSENWVEQNMFCPVCGHARLTHYANNRPVADFYCESCHSDFELKSKSSKTGKLGKKIPAGAYNTLISRIREKNNPNFIFLTYYNNVVNNVVIVPKYFFVPDIIEKRKPLSEKAQRSGWVGCNILIDNIPQSGMIFLIKSCNVIDKDIAVAQYGSTKPIHDLDLYKRGWIMDILNCIDSISSNEFTLEQMYKFEKSLQSKHQTNKHIRDKIRQQLQRVRDLGLIEFVSRGHYRKIQTSMAQR